MLFASCPRIRMRLCARLSAARPQGCRALAALAADTPIWESVAKRRHGCQARNALPSTASIANGRQRGMRCQAPPALPPAASAERVAKRRQRCQRLPARNALPSAASVANGCQRGTRGCRFRKLPGVVKQCRMLPVRADWGHQNIGIPLVPLFPRSTCKNGLIVLRTKCTHTSCVVTHDRGVPQRFPPRFRPRCGPVFPGDHR